MSPDFPTIAPQYPLRLAVIWVALAAAACETSAASQPPAPVPTDEIWLTTQQLRDAHVEVAAVAGHTVGNEVVTSGKIAFDDLRVAHLFSPVSGRVKRILAQPGERTKKGAPLAVIESPDVGNAFADLGKADADLTAARHDLARQKELYEAHAASQRDYEAAQDSFAKAKAEMDRAHQKAALFRSGTANAVTQEFTLRSPIDGEVISRNLNPGAEVQGQYAGGGAVELFTIGELDSVWVLADVFEMDLGRIHKGAPVTLKVVAYPDRSFTGHVDYISDALDPVARTARVRCAVASPTRELKPEMYATVSIGVGGGRVPAVPRATVLHIADQTVVFVEGGAAPDGRVRFTRRVVAVDETEGATYVPVVRGLALGERVVVSGGILLSGML
jgi:cobalt-zinc-cadmium efflux system membrane fusion protein